VAIDLLNARDIVSTLSVMLEAQGFSEAKDIVDEAEATIENTGYDNWNGGTDLYTLWLQIDPRAFAMLGERREAIQTQLTKQIGPIIDRLSNDWVAVEIRPRIAGATDNGETSRVTDVTRKRIRDFFVISAVSWWGDVTETDFLGRLYDLDGLSSTDPRYSSAKGDVRQHRENNWDWPADWVFSDKRFELATSDKRLLRLLAESVHPAIRRDEVEARKLVKEINKILQLDGWELASTEELSGRPCYAAQRIHSGAVRAVHRAHATADALDAEWMRREIHRIEKAVDTDPTLAVGTAKELVETCCKTILGRLKVEAPKGADLPKLVKLVSTELKLVPDSISESARGADVIRGILRNLASITQGLAELRGLYGTGHGRDGKYRGLSPRHARLAVATAVAFIDFVTETYRERER